MNKKSIFSFLIGVVITAVIMFLFLKPSKEVEVSELEEDVRGIYGKLVELGYTPELSNVKMDMMIEKVQEASNWVPKGTVTASDVLEGKTFYNSSRDLQTGTYVPEEFEFLGDASVDDVLEGKLFYSNDEELLTGTLKLSSTSTVSYRGDASTSDVLAGKTFYSNSGTLRTGTYTPPVVSYLGTASISDVLAGKTFYSNSGTLKTGTYTPPVVSYLGDALVTDVMSGKKFYSNSGTLLTGTWSFLGDAGVDEVLSGKKFYSDSGTLLTGTYTPPTPIDFTNMQYSTYEDYAGIDYLGEGGTLTEDYKGEESEWTEYTSGLDEVWKDERTGVYWSSDQTLVMLGQDPSIPNTNEFSAMSLDSCDYFNSVPRSSYDGTDSDCGNAINWCATLDFAGRTDWYLPSQKELMMAYIDGMYNQAGDTLQDAAEFTVGVGWETHYGGYWSSSQASIDSANAWFVYLGSGGTEYGNKFNTFHGVRCVSRDL